MTVHTKRVPTAGLGLGAEGNSNSNAYGTLQVMPLKEDPAEITNLISSVKLGSGYT